MRNAYRGLQIVPDNVRKIAVHYSPNWNETIASVSTQFAPEPRKQTVLFECVPELGIPQKQANSRGLRGSRG
jgi:hypothetical protein